MEEKNEMPLLFNNDWRNWVFIAVVGLIGCGMLFSGLILLIKDFIAQM